MVEWLSLSPEKPGYDTGNGTERRASEQEGGSGPITRL